MPPTRPRSDPDHRGAEHAPAALTFASPLASVPGIGPKRAESFRRAGLEVVLDLLLLTPLRWVKEPELGVRPESGPFCVLGTVQSRKKGRMRSVPGGYLELGVQTEHEKVQVRFYRQAFLFEKFLPGTRFLGVVTARREKPAELVALRGYSLSAQDDPAEVLRAPRPVWPKVEGLPVGILARLLRTTQRLLADSEDPLPEEVRIAQSLPSLSEAFRGLHAPDSFEAVRLANERLLFDRCLARAMATPAITGEPGLGPVIRASELVRRRIRARFPWPFTCGQEQALAVLWSELEGPKPMRRLLHGDVGSGKTAVALATALAAIASKFQVLFLAPTETLAEQHFATLDHLLRGSRVGCAILTRSIERTKVRETLRGLADGSVHLAVGTQSLLSKRLSVKNLGLVIIDEQHRFGVAQRLAAVRKGRSVHLLSMSATPIPRSLSVALGGSLNLLGVGGRPAGRQLPPCRLAKMKEALTLVREVAAKGERVYLVFPSIDGESGASVAKGVPALFGPRKALAHLSFAVAHGRLPSAERAAAIGRFRAGEVSVLVATTVIEVGVDVPEATLIVVFGAERLGLSSLHQLRGRVGRGTEPGQALLVPSAKADPRTSDRLAVLERTDDGAVIAEEDLRQRGPGDLLGLRQSGFGARLQLESGRDREISAAATECAKAGLLPRTNAYLDRLREGQDRLLLVPEDAG